MTIVQFLLIDIAGLLALVGFSRGMAGLLDRLIRYLESLEA